MARAQGIQYLRRVDGQCIGGNTFRGLAEDEGLFLRSGEEFSGWENFDAVERIERQQVTVTADDHVRPGGNGGFEYFIVLGITADVDGRRWFNDFRCFINDIDQPGGQGIIVEQVFELGTTENIAHFFNDERGCE